MNINGFELDTNKAIKNHWYSFTYDGSQFAFRVLDNGNVELAETS